MPGQIRIDRSTALRDCELKPAAVSWPRAIDAYLDSLVAVAEAVNERTNRRELLAAIVLAVKPDGTRLARILREYRGATVADITSDAEAEGDFAVFERHRPGPRHRP
jgi:hypothetical protein